MSSYPALVLDYAAQAGYEETLSNHEEGNFTYSGRRGDETFFVNMAVDLEDGKTIIGALVYDKKLPGE